MGARLNAPGGVSTPLLVLVSLLIGALLVVSTVAFSAWIAGPDCWERDSDGRKMAYDYTSAGCNG